MEKRLFKAFTAILLIITLTMANFLMSFVNFVSYASDTFNANKSTNNRNVEFIAYFKDEEGNRLSEKEALTNNEDLMLYVEVAVKREGYFNGEVILNNSNFRFNPEIVDESINRIEGNRVYLNQINAGSEKEISLKIDILKEDIFDLSLINMNSEVCLEGIYRDSKEKDISVSARKEVSLTLVSPYNTIEEYIVLSQDIITNKIFEINGQNKRIVQISINSGANENLYPVKSATINIQTPKILDRYPENVMVNSNGVLVTNGELLSADNFNYNKETGIIEINIENTEKDGKVSWLKEGTDKIILTFIFDEEVELNGEELNINSEIKLYDINKTTLRANSMKQLSRREKDTIVTSELIQNEEEIYKGKLYAGIERDITYKNIIDINLNNVFDFASVDENKQTIGNRSLDSVYKTTKISKSNIEQVLGENGTLEIIDLNNSNVITTINKDSESDQDGNIVITYPENVEEVRFKITAPDKIGRLELENTKTIRTVSKTVLAQENTITTKSDVSYNIGDNENTLESSESVINLKETELKADLQISRRQISAMTKNENVEFRIVLNSKEEKDELFKNPTLKLELPEKIEEIEVNSINLVYEDEMEIKSATLNNNTINITLKGEQTKYKEEAVDGTIIIINANLKTSRKLPNSVEQVKLDYTNKGVTKSITRDLEIISYVGVVTTNQVSNYGIEVINNEGNNSAELAMSSNRKVINIEKQIINNKDNAITNVNILGTFPTKEATENNNIDTQVGDIAVQGIDSNRVRVYYSNNENATQDLENAENNWTEEIGDRANAKKYLVCIDKLDVLEEINLSYEVMIPSNLVYNQVAEEGYTVYYSSMGRAERTDTTSIRLATPRGTVVETTLKALVQDNEVNTVKENSILRYQIEVNNAGSEDVSNVIVNAVVPEGTVYSNLKDITNIETDDSPESINIDDIPMTDENKKELEFNIGSLKAGENKTIYYEVQIKGNMAGNRITNVVNTTYGEVTKASNEVTVLVEEGTLELNLVSPGTEKGVVKSGYNYRQFLHITNKSSREMKNIVTIINVDNLDIKEIYYIDSDNKVISEKNTNRIEISKIQPGETIIISMHSAVPIFKDNISKDVKISAIANCNNTEYKSNQINLIAKTDLAYNLNVSSENSGGYVKAGDIIKYNVTIKNESENRTKEIVLNTLISNDVTLVKVLKDGVELTEEQYSLSIDRDRQQKILKITNNDLEPEKTVNYQIEVVVNLLFGNRDATEINSEYSLTLDTFEIATGKILHVLQPETTSNGNNNNNNDNNNDDNNNGDENNVNPNENQEYKIIYGIAWIDENEDGIKDMQEKALQGVKVRLINVTTNEFERDVDGNIMETYTTETGFYNFSKVINGQYIVIFEYDTTQYGLTAFEKEGVANEVNSNVITKNIYIDGVETQVAATEIITVMNDNISNINIGLIPAKRYDLQLDKYISKVTVQNNKTETNTYVDSSLVKQEIDSKQVNNTTIVVEYKIRVTNKGDVTGYVKKIADYLPADYKFNSELNKDWYQSENNIYCTSLSEEPIQPGESKEVTLTVIKKMTESNTGLINNTAEIVKSYNEFGLTDINSTEGNKLKGENDMGSADLIISIKTGQVIMIVSLIISSIVILGVAIILLRRTILNKRLF